MTPHESKKTLDQATEPPYKLTFYYEDETTRSSHHLTDSREIHTNYDGLIVQSYDDNTQGKHAARYAKDLNEHGTGCLLSAFLYFITITSFVYLAVLWIKQRMHVHVEQMQWW